MAKIDLQIDCGNAPRKLFLKNFNMAIANGNIEFLEEVVPEGINWVIVGKKKVIGKENYLAEIKKHQLWKVKELVVDTIITHGPDASVCGQILTTGNLKFSFSEVYRFKGAGGSTINCITTFVIRQ